MLYFKKSDDEGTSDSVKELSHVWDINESLSLKVSQFYGLTMTQVRGHTKFYAFLFSDGALENWLVVICSETQKMLLVKKLPTIKQFLIKSGQFNILK